MMERTIAGYPVHYWITDNTSESCIIFLHPAFASHHCFDSQVPHFAKTNKVITLDIIGHGKSIGKGKISDMANCIAAIMKDEHIDKAHLVGVSMGTVLAQDFANNYPEQVTSLCCVGGYDINNFSAGLQKGNSKEHIRMMLRALLSVKWFADANKRISAYTEKAQEEFYRMNLEFKKSSFRYIADLGSMVNRHESGNRNYPLMIGVGEHDSEMAKTAAEQWHANEPGSHFVCFKNAGHIVNLDTPEKFNDELDAFMRRA